MSAVLLNFSAVLMDRLKLKLVYVLYNRKLRKRYPVPAESYAMYCCVCPSAIAMSNAIACATGGSIVLLLNTCGITRRRVWIDSDLICLVIFHRHVNSGSFTIVNCRRNRFI